MHTPTIVDLFAGPGGWDIAARWLGFDPIGIELNAAFAYWMFRLLGARIGDTLDDLYPGSGGIARAWAHYQDPSALLEP